MLIIVVFVLLLLFFIFVIKIEKKQQVWKISLFNIISKEAVKSTTPKSYFSPLNKIRTRYHYCTGYADPFLFVHNDYLYLFYEEERLKAPALIKGYRTRNLERWEDIGVVLQESCHLSFPFVFRANGGIYMLPETRAKDAVILYKAIEFPYKWEPKIILSGDKFTDSSVILHNGKWFLFTSVWYGKKNGLHIYYSDDLESTSWHEHPMSPIHNDLGFSRNGGAVFWDEGKLYRPAQNCTNYYGENVALYEIDKLSIAEYEEHKVDDLIDKNNKWSIYGGHHFNMVEFQNQKIAVMDGIVNDNWINNHTRKLFNFYHNKIKR